MLTFEQAWNVIQVNNPGLLAGIDAADAARGRFCGNNFAREVASWVRSAVKAGHATAGHVVARARYHAGILQGSAECAALAACYEARNRAKA